MQPTTFWPRLAVLLAIDIVLGLVYANIPTTFLLGRHVIAAVQLVGLTATMLITVARVSRDF